MGKASDRDSLVRLLAPVVDRPGARPRGRRRHPGRQAPACCAWSSTRTAASALDTVAAREHRGLRRARRVRRDGRRAVRARGDLARRRPAADRAAALAAQPRPGWSKVVDRRGRPRSRAGWSRSTTTASASTSDGVRDPARLGPSSASGRVQVEFNRPSKPTESDEEG